MKKFSDKTRRRIELLRRLKKQSELVARQAFDHTRGRADAVRRGLADLTGSLTEQTRAVRTLLLSGGPVDMGCYAVFMRDTRRAMAMHAESLAAADKQADESRDEFLAARRQREAADLLADRMTRGEVSFARRSEARELDEITTVAADAV